MPLRDLASRVPRMFLAVSCLLLPVAPALAQYKWTDPQGRIVYGDNPPREARNVERIDARGASGEADALAALPYESRRAARQFPVVLYTTASCAPCDAGRQLLRARGVPFSERTITTRQDNEQFEKLGYGNRLPVMTLGRQVQREFETSAWHAALDAAGYPRAGGLPRGWQPAVAPLAPEPAPAAVPAGDTTPEEKPGG